MAIIFVNVASAFALCQSSRCAHLHRVSRVTCSLAGAGTWSRHCTEDNEEYFYQASSGTSSWELPEGAVLEKDGAAGLGAYAAQGAASAGTWQSYESEDGEYFHNAETGATSWELPPDAQLVADADVAAAAADTAADTATAAADYYQEGTTVLRGLNAQAGDPQQSPLSAVLSSVNEVWLSSREIDVEIEGEAPPALGESVAAGEVVLCLPYVVEEEEVQWLLRAALEACGEAPPSTGRRRFCVSDPEAFLSTEVMLRCEEVLLRVLDSLDDECPSIYSTLFAPGEGWAARQPLNARGVQPKSADGPPAHLAVTCPTLRDLYLAGELEWSEGEPAINVYGAGGQFGCHKDHLALTVLIPLTAPGTDFAGGGTGFWAGNRETSEDPQSNPTAVLTPALGTALVFGGDVTHAGMPVQAGLRAVFVASFSTRTPASRVERCRGLQSREVRVSEAFRSAR